LIILNATKLAEILIQIGDFMKEFAFAISSRETPSGVSPLVSQCQIEYSRHRVPINWMVNLWVRIIA